MRTRFESVRRHRAHGRVAARDRPEVGAGGANDDRGRDGRLRQPTRRFSTTLLGLFTVSGVLLALIGATAWSPSSFAAHQGDRRARHPRRETGRYPPARAGRVFARRGRDRAWRRRALAMRPLLSRFLFAVTATDSTIVAGVSFADHPASRSRHAIPRRGARHDSTPCERCESHSRPRETARRSPRLGVADGTTAVYEQLNASPRPAGGRNTVTITLPARRADPPNGRAELSHGRGEIRTRERLSPPHAFQAWLASPARWQPAHSHSDRTRICPGRASYIVQAARFYRHPNRHLGHSRLLLRWNRCRHQQRPVPGIRTGTWSATEPAGCGGVSVRSDLAHARRLHRRCHSIDDGEVPNRRPRSRLGRPDGPDGRLRGIPVVRRPDITRWIDRHVGQHLNAAVWKTWMTSPGFVPPDVPCVGSRHQHHPSCDPGDADPDVVVAVDVQTPGDVNRPPPV